jgi:hypothetical protein
VKGNGVLVAGTVPIEEMVGIECIRVQIEALDKVTEVQKEPKESNKN